MKHLVQFSTGLSSAEVAWRLVAEHGRRDVVLLTADTTKEDPDSRNSVCAASGTLAKEYQPEPVVTTTMFTGPERAAWQVAVDRGLSIEAADLRALLAAAAPLIRDEGRDGGGLP